MDKRKRDFVPPKSFGEYMQNKVRKLDMQFENQFKSDQQVSTLFKGVVIWVDGYTIPSQQELKELMGLHGGDFQIYHSSKVTHIITNNLPDSKIKQLSRSDLIVKPQWIVDSIAASKLLPVQDYLLLPPKGITPLFSKKMPVYEDSGGIGNGDEKSKECGALGTRKEVHIQAPSGRSMSTASGDMKEFMKQYYGASRLHHLSTWRMHFQQITNKSISIPEQRVDQSEDDMRGENRLATLLEDNHNDVVDSHEVDTTCRIICHVDMDCFFASVSLRDKPHLMGLPVVVCHAQTHQESGKSSGEIACASYEARKYGVRNGMWMKEAIKLCPNLVTIPYEFEKYQKTSEQIYQLFAQVTHKIQACSCDEAYLDLSEIKDYTRAVSDLRKAVFETTGCSMSAGIGHNMLLARIATKIAKPNGQYYISQESAQQHINSLSVRDIPGVGWMLGRKLEEIGVKTCQDLVQLQKEHLQKVFGPKTGLMLWNFSRGVDDRPLQLHQERKSVGCEISWGVRFSKEEDAFEFIDQLSREVCERLSEGKLEGKHVTLKLKIRKQDAPVDPPKFLGHGLCDNYSKSCSLPRFIHTQNDIAKECWVMFKNFKTEKQFMIQDVRGVGVSLSKLQEKSAEGRCYKSLERFFLQAHPSVWSNISHV
eukprot:TRINITY_DN9823_c0_g1_i1.p1 TRINITY_DN9823_c0_g1~~TRINITY_DN9823_c0_g1_i1.p1  ORF type:complete len:649 (+),score=84.81 TRINITY_DN9823_c0_g1_i1:78-2024(+)